jgi:hypothetical protein
MEDGEPGGRPDDRQTLADALDDLTREELA